jgi:hypothetical protein
MSNSIRTPRLGVTANSKRIAQAVDDEEWQKFRVSMKGKSTREKLDMLRGYWEAPTETLGATDDDVFIRVDNYIKALCRGGLLYAGCDIEAMADGGWSSNWIKRG